MSLRYLLAGLLTLTLLECSLPEPCWADPFVQGRIFEELPGGGQQPLGDVIVTARVERTNQRLDARRSRSDTGFYKLDLSGAADEPILVTFTPAGAGVAVSEDRLLSGDRDQVLSKVLQPGGSLQSYSTQLKVRKGDQEDEIEVLEPREETDSMLQDALEKLLEFEAFNYRMQRFGEGDDFDRWTQAQIYRYLKGMPAPHQLRSLGGGPYREGLYQALVRKYRDVRDLYGIDDSVPLPCPTPHFHPCPQPTGHHRTLRCRILFRR